MQSRVGGGDQHEEDDEGDDGEDHDEDAGEEPSVGVSAVHGVVVGGTLLDAPVRSQVGAAAVGAKVPFWREKNVRSLRSPACINAIVSFTTYLFTAMAAEIFLLLFWNL